MQNIFRISGVFIFTLSTILTSSCKEEDVPTLTTSEISDITATTATSGGSIIDEGSSIVTTYGVCWSKDTLPTINDNKTLDGNGVSSFISKIESLDGGTRYYLRAYASNATGTGYGITKSFTTYPSNVTDVQGFVYNVVVIGTQIWMKENLRTTRYNNGDIIGTTSPSTLDISNETIPIFQWAFSGNEDNVAAFGRLYTWQAIMDSRNVCPSGWHVPTNSDWVELTNYLGGEAIAGPKLKSTTGWMGGPFSPDNSSGFSALPGGYRNPSGGFVRVGGPMIGGYMDVILNFGYWWSSTESSAADAWSRNMFSDLRRVGVTSMNKSSGLAVRCLKNN